MKSPITSHKGLSVERLRAFCAVIEAGSLIGAAEGDPTRQSQISRQLKELEDGLEVRLFDRVNRRLIPTAIGRELALMTKSFFAGVTELQRLDRQDGEVVRIAAGESSLSGFVFPRFDRMRAALPQCRFSFAQRSTTDSVQMLKDGQADVAIVRDSADLDGLETSRIGPARFRLVVPRRLLPSRQREGLACINGLPIALLSGGGEFTQMLTALLKDAGVEIRHIAESDTFGGLRELVLTGAAAAVLPEWTAKTLPTEQISIVSNAALDPLNRSLVAATHPRLPHLRPTISATVQTLSDIWRP